MSTAFDPKKPVCTCTLEYLDKKYPSLAPTSSCPVCEAINPSCKAVIGLHPSTASSSSSSSTGTPSSISSSSFIFREPPKGSCQWSPPLSISYQSIRSFLLTHGYRSHRGRAVQSENDLVILCAGQRSILRNDADVVAFINAFGGKEGIHGMNAVALHLGTAADIASYSPPSTSSERKSAANSQPPSPPRDDLPPIHPSASMTSSSPSTSIAPPLVHADPTSAAPISAAHPSSTSSTPRPPTFIADLTAENLNALENSGVSSALPSHPSQVDPTGYSQDGEAAVNSEAPTSVHGKSEVSSARPSTISS